MPDEFPHNLDGCPAADDLSDEEIRRVAKMARLVVEDSEIHAIRQELCKVLGWAAMLKEVDAEHLNPGSDHMESRLEPDEPGAMLDRSVLDGIAPATDGPFIRVPKVLGSGGGA